MSDVREFVRDKVCINEGKPQAFKPEDLNGHPVEVVLDHLVQDYCLLVGSPEDMKGDSLDSKRSQFEGHTYATKFPLAAMLKALLPVKDADATNPYFVDKNKPESLNLEGISLKSLNKRGYVYVIADTHGFENYPQYSWQYRKPYHERSGPCYIAKIEVRKEDFLDIITKK